MNNSPPVAFAGQPLRYLIGTDDYSGIHDHDGVLEVSYDESHGQIGYCNLFNEKYSEQSNAVRRKYGPYLHDSDTAEEYEEGQIDPRGAGWHRNLVEQFERRRAQGFSFIELDNPDAYSWANVEQAIQIAYSYGLKVMAKNPGLCFKSMVDRISYVRHCYGIIVERGAGLPAEMDALRRNAGLSDLMVWFVFFDEHGSTAGQIAANSCARAASAYKHMGVTYSPHGEYTHCLDVLKPA
jgi:hypothetical protein